MWKNTNKFFALFCLAILFIEAKGSANEECEIKEKSYKSFVKRYNMSTDMFITSKLYESKHLYHNEGMAKRNYEQYFNIKMTKHFEPLKTFGGKIIFHFIYGEDATCHQINPATGENKETHIGMNSKNFFCVIDAGNLYTIDFEKHPKKSFALIGVTVVYKPTDTAVIKVYTKEESVAWFPQQRQLIEHVYERY